MKSGKHGYKEDIGKYYNMKTQVFEDELYYICCHEGDLHHIGPKPKTGWLYTGF